MVFRLILKGILKESLRLISSLDEVLSNFGEFVIKYKMGLILFLFSTSGLGHRIFSALPMQCIAEFKGREK